MGSHVPAGAERSAAKRRNGAAFSEAGAWETVGDGWQPLHGNFRELGYSVEWHDFRTECDFDWSRSFHPGGVEICLNVAGRGDVQAGNRALALTPSTAGFYAQNESRLAARRQGGELHQFITVELSLEFLERHVPVGERGLDPRLGRLFSGDGRRAMVVSEPMRLTSDMRQMVVSLRRPPVYAAAQRLWYQAKVLEVAAALLYQPLAEEELFCARWKRLSQERVQRVVAILKENLAEPPSLEELGRRIGCSHYYLSRLFTQEMGKTISAHLRDLRLEQAAERLREGKMNVTEVAVAVGYSSLSHFSAAFRETFGCCPGLYPVATVSQRAARREDS